MTSMTEWNKEQLNELVPIYNAFKKQVLKQKKNTQQQQNTKQ